MQAHHRATEAARHRRLESVAIGLGVGLPAAVVAGLLASAFDAALGWEGHPSLTDYVVARLTLGVLLAAPIVLVLGVLARRRRRASGLARSTLLTGLWVLNALLFVAAALLAIPELWNLGRGAPRS